MVAGVGKTYAMLEAGRERRSEGVDVVVGYVDTHGRIETELLLQGLEVLPRRTVEYRGTRLEDMDLDAVLARRPELALVDELAHTNAPGLRHRKRYQDVMELLEAGIDVYTTVNVQHFESRADAVAQITGVTVHETVPDSLLDLADEIELIDLPPEDLRKRLAEGKVYTPERADVAARNFFRIGNLTALREMALRLTAEHVDHKLQDYMQVKHIAGPWKSGERLLVAVGSSPFSEQAVRWTRRMAYNLEAPWLAVHVETAHTLSDAEQAQLARNLELGAQPGRRGGDHSRQRRGRRHRARGAPAQRNPDRSRQADAAAWWHAGPRQALVNNLIRISGDIDIYVVSGEDETAAPLRPVAACQPNALALGKLSWSAAIVAAVTAVLVLVFETYPWFGYQAVGLMELFTVLLIAIYLGRGPALLAAFLSAISWNFLFITPRLTFAISAVAGLDSLCALLCHCPVGRQLDGPAPPAGAIGQL